jgi:bifunctional N-acetylglucosamine-1-phosphate-uridyltransferase/glucosamine-1-phosphate-acetyltransferase GlmU-like protein
MLLASSFFDTTAYRHRTIFSDCEPVWSALNNLKRYMDGYQYQAEILKPIADGVPLQKPVVLHDNSLIAAEACEIIYGGTCKGNLTISRSGSLLDGASLIMAGTILIGSKISIGRGSLIEGGATIKEPAVIGNCTEIRHGAYMRGYCLIGDRCVVGHTTEVKHSIFLDDAKAGHFAYLGDSILGNNANLGAGTKFANLKFIAGNVTILIDGKLQDSGMRKFGAILGDNAQTGCNAVTSPGTILGKKGILMPNTTAPSGYHHDHQRIR